MATVIYDLLPGSPLYKMPFVEWLGIGGCNLPVFELDRTRRGSGCKSWEEFLTLTLGQIQTINREAGRILAKHAWIEGLGAVSREVHTRPY